VLNTHKMKKHFDLEITDASGSQCEWVALWVAACDDLSPICHMLGLD
jgi:hypothetical protein